MSSDPELLGWIVGIGIYLVWVSITIGVNDKVIGNSWLWVASIKKTITVIVCISVIPNAVTVSI